MNIAITGAEGFIGTHLTNLLEKKRRFSLFCLDKTRHDLLKPSSLEEFVSNKDVIVHLAAVNRDSDTAIIAGSVCTTYNLILAMKKVKSKAKIIFTSSIQAETESVYGLSKRLAEIMLKNVSEEFNIPVAIFRISNVFGEGCRPFYNSVIATFCHQVAHGEEVRIIENREVNFIYVGDVVNEIFKEIISRSKNLYCVKTFVSKNTLSVSELAEIIRSFEKLDRPGTEPEFKSKFHKDLYATYLSYRDKDR